MFGLGKKDSRADKSKSSGKTHVADALRCEALTPADPSALVFSAGVPGTADALAYEQYQGIVAVSTSDGRIKLMGRPGVERTLYSAARYPYATRQLAWLKNRGVLMRVSKGGFMESWSVASGPKSEGGVRALGTLKVKHDKVCCVADMARDPYVLLGCASGCLRIAQLVDGQGEPTSQARHARGFGLAPYRIRPEELGGEGSVQQLAVQSFGPIHRALVLFTGGMVAVWDLRAAQLISLVNPADPEAAARAPALAAAGEATAVCWIGTSRGDFATGHVDGSVLVWALPGLDVGEAELAAVLRVVSSTAEPIRMLRCLYGEVDGLLVAGGQEVEAPEGLTLLPLPDAEEHEEEDAEEEAEEEGEDEEAAERRRKARRRSKRPRRVKLPWFGPIIGFSLVTQGGNINGYEDPCAVLELVEGGQLVLYHLGSRQPSAVGPAFQQRTTISVAEAPLVPVRRPSGAPAAAITLSGLRRVAPCPDAGAGSDEEGSEEDPDDPGGLGAFACGSPPLVPSDAGWGLVYCTGYKDGGVCLWDLHGGTTRRLASAPAGEAADATKLGGSGGGAGSSAGGAGGSAHGCGAVTCLSLIWPTGLVVTGHARGEARVYQFSPTERAVECVTLDSVNTAGTSSRPLRQPAGLQLRLRVRVSSGEVSSLAYNQAIRALAIGDRAGGIALVDTSKPLVRWVAMPGQQPVAALALAPLPLPPQRLRVPEVLGEEGAPSCCVVAADGEGCLAALDAARGCFVGRGGELRPKNTSTPLCLELLDEAHRPLWGRQALGAGCDQAALGGGGGGGGAAGTSRARVPESEGSEDDEDEEDPDLDPDADLDELLARAAAHVDGRGGGAGSRKAKARGAQKGGGGAGSRHRAGSDDLDDASVGTGVATAACPDPTAHYVLLVTDRYLRLYSAASVLTGERAVESKRSPAEGAALVFAQPLAVGGAPGVVALATAEHGLALQVYSLPSLDLVHEAPLSACLSWFWDVPSGAERKLARLAACSRLGQLLLLGLSNELLGISLARALPPIPPPSGLFDGATASAALAAAAEYEEGHLRLDEGRLGRGQAQGEGLHGARSGLVPPAPITTDASTTEGIEGMDSPAVRTEGRRVEKYAPAAAATAAAKETADKAAAAAEKVTSAAKETAKEANVALTKVFARVQAGLSKAVEETTKGVKQLATNVQTALIDGGGSLGGAGGSGALGGPGAAGLAVAGAGARPPAAEGDHRSASWYASLPDLGAVFSRRIAEDDPTIQRMRRRRPAGGVAGAGGGGEDADEEDEDDVSILSITDDDDDEEDGRSHARGRGGPAAPAPRPASGALGQRRSQPPPSSAAGGRGGDSEDAMRNDLFGGARAYTPSGGGSAGPSRAPAPAYATKPAGPGGAPRTRTAEEIKRAYGREPKAASANARTGEVRDVMEQNKSKLEERGERLRRLDDKAADLEASAQGFAEMARQLADRERNKKWWAF